MCVRALRVSECSLSWTFHVSACCARCICTSLVALLEQFSTRCICFRFLCVSYSVHAIVVCVLLALLGEIFLSYLYFFRFYIIPSRTLSVSLSRVFVRCAFPVLIFATCVFPYGERVVLAFVRLLVGVLFRFLLDV